MMKLIAAVVLLARFLKAVVISGFQTVQVILRSSVGERKPPAAFLRVKFAPMTEQGASLLGCMITLTPGTTTIDIDMDKREILMHVLDASDTDALVKGIREDFEPGLIALFGVKA